MKFIISFVAATLSFSSAFADVQFEGKGESYLVESTFKFGTVEKRTRTTDCQVVRPDAKTYEIFLWNGRDWMHDSDLSFDKSQAKVSDSSGSYIALSPSDVSHILLCQDGAGPYKVKQVLREIYTKNSHGQITIQYEYYCQKGISKKGFLSYTGATCRF